MIREELRQKILADRDRLTVGELEEKSKAVFESFFKLAELQGTPTVMLYASFRSEVQTLAAIERSLLVGMKVALPLSLPEKRMLQPFLIKDLSKDLRPGYFSIPEPIPAKTISVDPGALDVVVVPGSVFDQKGGRLGYGGGFYDRFLAIRGVSPFRVALAFELQVVRDELPLEPHDQRLDCLVTEENVYRFNRSVVADGQGQSIN